MKNKTQKILALDLGTKTGWALGEISQDQNNQIKKHITGKGNANKQAVITAVKAQGFDPKDDNEADALALLSFVITNQGGSYA